jgi:lipoic acid synthetase
VHQRLPDVGLEFLSGDLNGNEEALASLLDGVPLKVFAHNVETVERLTPNIRDRKASFKKSLRILEAGKALRPDLLTKSSIMVGLGETNEDITETLAVLRSAGVELVTFGQYLAPGAGHVPVVSYPHPDQFDAWKQEALDAGFLAVASGPLVRSSFRAGGLYDEASAAR